MNRDHGTSSMPLLTQTRGQYFNKISNAVKIQKNMSPLEKWLVKGIQATRRRIAGKIPQRNINYLFY